MCLSLCLCIKKMCRCYRVLLVFAVPPVSPVGVGVGCFRCSGVSRCLLAWVVCVGVFSLFCGVFSCLFFLLFLLFLLLVLFLGVVLSSLSALVGVPLPVPCWCGWLGLASLLSLCGVVWVVRLLRLCLRWSLLSVLLVTPVCLCAWVFVRVGRVLAGSVPLLLLRLVLVLRLMCPLGLVSLSLPSCVLWFLSFLVVPLNLCGLSPSGGGPRGGWFPPPVSSWVSVLVSLWAILPVNCS